MIKQTAILLAMLFVLPFAMLAEDNDLKKLMNKYKDVKGFDLELADPDVDLDLDNNWDFGEFLNEIKKVYVLDFDKAEGNLDELKAFTARLDKLIDKKGFSTLVDIGGDGSVRILSRKGDSGKTTDFLIITDDKEDAKATLKQMQYEIDNDIWNTTYNK